MPVGPGSTIDEVWKFGESDSNSLFSDLLNRLGDSVRSALNALKARVTSLESSYSLIEASTGIRHYSVADSPALLALTGMSMNDLCETRNSNSVFRYHGAVHGWKAWQTEWYDMATTGTIGAGWTQTGGAWRILDGCIQMRGQLSGGASGSNAYTFPAGFRPDSLRRVVVVTGASAGTTPATITTAGAMIANTATDFTLDGVRFPLYNV